MADYLIDGQILEDIASSVRRKKESGDFFKPQEIPEEIDKLTCANGQIRAYLFNEKKNFPNSIDFNLYEPVPTPGVLYHASVDGDYIGSSYANLIKTEYDEYVELYIDREGHSYPYVRYHGGGDGWAAVTMDDTRRTVSVWTGGAVPTDQPPEEEGEENYNNQIFLKHISPGDTWELTLQPGISYTVYYGNEKLGTWKAGIDDDYQHTFESNNARIDYDNSIWSCSYAYADDYVQIIQNNELGKYQEKQWVLYTNARESEYLYINGGLLFSNSEPFYLKYELEDVPNSEFSPIGSPFRLKELSTSKIYDVYNAINGERVGCLIYEVVDVRYSVKFPTGHWVNYGTNWDGPLEEYVPCNLRQGDNTILRFNLADNVRINNNQLEINLSSYGEDRGTKTLTVTEGETIEVNLETLFSTSMSANGYFTVTVQFSINDVTYIVSRGVDYP